MEINYFDDFGRWAQDEEVPVGPMGNDLLLISSGLGEFRCSGTQIGVKEILTQFIA